MRLPVAILVFVAASVTAAVALAFPLGGLSRGLAWASFAIGAAAAVAAWRGIPPQTSQAPSTWDLLLLGLFALASLRAFLWLIYPVGDEWRVLSPNNLGDLALHIHMIRYLGSGVDFWPESPILAGVPLTYPLGTDLLNTLLLCSGIPLEKGLIWVALSGASLTAWALWKWGGAFALAALLFNGGLAGILVFYGGPSDGIATELAWKNLFLSMFVTQRGLLYALPAGLFLLHSWREEILRQPARIPTWVAFTLYSTMPLFSVHTFLFLSLVLACGFLLCPALRSRLGCFVAAAFVPATAAVYFVTGSFSASSGLRWLPGWMQGDEGWLFWLWNFGVTLPLLALLLWQVIRERRPEQLCFVGVGLFVFGLCCFVSFAQWEWDNTKLFLWGWLACAPFLFAMISNWPRSIQIPTYIALFFSGALSLVEGLDNRHGYQLAVRSELANADAIFQQVPQEARLAVKPDFNNPAILLGRPVLCGYEGHLWSHGLNYRKQWEALQEALKQQPNWEMALRSAGAQWFFLQGPPPLILNLTDTDSPITLPPADHGTRERP